MMSFVADSTKQRRETRRPLRCSRSLGWKWPEISGRGSPRHRLVAKHDPADFHLVLDCAAAMVGESGIVVADDPHPVEPRCQLGQQLARARRAVDRSRSVMEAVAEAIEALRAAAFHFGSERRQRRMRIIGRKELPKPCEPARLFEMQVGDEQRLARRAKTARRRLSPRMFRLRTKREPCRPV